MTTESVDSQMIRGITKASSGFLRLSYMGKVAVSSNNHEHDIPNYRRASIGSCHDFCKYGNKQEIEPERRFPTIKRVASKSFDSHPIQVLVPPERNKSIISLAKPSSKPSPYLETTPISADVLNTAKVEASVNSSSLTKSPTVSKVSDEKKKKIWAAKTKPSSYSNTSKSNSGAPKAIKPKVSSKQPSPSDVKEKKSPSSGDTNLSKPRYMKEKLVISSGSLGGANGRGNDDVKIRKSTAALKGTTKKASKITPTVSSSSKNVNGVANSNSGKYNIRKAGSPFKNQNKIGKAKLEEEAQNVEVKEKTLYVVKIKTENNSRPLESNALESSRPLESDPYETNIFESSPNPNSPSISSQDQHQSEEYAVDQDEIMYYSEDEEVDNDKKEEILDGRKKKNNKLSPEERDAPASKLSFQRGKLVDVQAENNNGPRRLKFRRGKVSGENQKYNNAHRRNFKREEANNKTKESEPAPEEVVLRHQDLQEKKDAQGLFNNVIEETANKLAETRKSKVKALVGAFETVISLQECKASSLNTIA